MSETYRIETHTHTSTVSPCGCLSPEELVQGYLRADYDGIVVTDHLTASLPVIENIGPWKERVSLFFSGFRAARLAAESSGLAVFPGFELTLPDLPGRDFLVYGIDEKLLAELPELCTMRMESFKALAEEVGALVFQAHPFRNGQPVDPAFIDGIEVYNGNPRHESRNDLAGAFAAEHGLLVSSGSDAHRLEDVGRGGITVQQMPASITDLVQSWQTEQEEIGLLISSETRS